MSRAARRTRRTRAGLTLLCAATVLALSGCGGDDEPAVVPADGAGELPQGAEPAGVDPGELSPEITNEYWPMAPGTRWTYRETDGDSELRVVVTVTGVTREIADGSTARVVRDTVTEDGEIIEDTFDWYAQDDAGNVWYLGEDTAEFEDGRIATREGSFEAGVDGALPGVIMPGDPAPGLAYRQEYYENEAEDNGEVLSLDEMAEVPAGQYDEVLLTKDTITIEPDVQEYKLYAPGVGPVLVFGVSGGAGREELVSMTTVSPAEAERAGSVPLGAAYDAASYDSTSR